ncbi:MAG: polysaccharide deacetylase family protein [Candidatus Pacebacteria bacterium]|nr:polysaccharide deacetylase family protein [Candidatus Paceibacterota bacterium]
MTSKERENKLFVTTSWDDGNPLDMRVAALLDLYQMKGTFYVSKNYVRGGLQENDIRKLSQRHEIGAHTINHPDLTRVSGQDVRREILGSKVWIEECIKQKVTSFCYPEGKFNDLITKIVKESGFTIGRTVEKYDIRQPIDLLHFNTSIKVYPFPFRKKDARAFYWADLLRPIKKDRELLKKQNISYWKMTNWLSMTKAVFDEAIKHGSVYHLWGHSWEIEKYNMWKDFELLLKYISKRSNCIYGTNKELLSKI